MSPSSQPWGCLYNSRNRFGGYNWIQVLMAREEYTGLTKLSLMSEQVRRVLHSPNKEEDREGFRLSAQHHKNVVFVQDRNVVFTLFIFLIYACVLFHVTQNALSLRVFIDGGRNHNSIAQHSHCASLSIVGQCMLGGKGDWAEKRPSGHKSTQRPRLLPGPSFTCRSFTRTLTSPDAGM